MSDNMEQYPPSYPGHLDPDGNLLPHHPRNLWGWLNQCVRGTSLNKDKVEVPLCIGDSEFSPYKGVVELPEEWWDLRNLSATDPARVEFAKRYPTNFTIVDVPKALLDGDIVTITWGKYEGMEDWVDINQTAFELYKDNLALKEELRILKEQRNL